MYEATALPTEPKLLPMDVFIWSHFPFNVFSFFLSFFYYLFLGVRQSVSKSVAATIIDPTVFLLRAQPRKSKIFHGKRTSVLVYKYHYAPTTKFCFTLCCKIAVTAIASCCN